MQTVAVTQNVEGMKLNAAEVVREVTFAYPDDSSRNFRNLAFDVKNTFFSSFSGSNRIV